MLKKIICSKYDKHSRQNEMKIKVGEAKKLMGLKVRQDGVKPANSLEWRSAIASVRKRLIST